MEMISSSPESTSPPSGVPASSAPGSGEPGTDEPGSAGLSAAGASGGDQANAAALYARISGNATLTQELFRQALQDPGGALDRIVALGQSYGLPVSREAVKAHVASLDDTASKQWLLKARGGL